MRAAFLAAVIPKTGPEVILLHPEETLSKNEIAQLSLICMPMGSKEGDFASIIFNGYQVAGYLTSTPPIDLTLDPRDTIVSIGFLLDTYTDPTPYRDVLIEFVNKCGKTDSFTLSNLKEILPRFLALKEEKNVIINLDNETSCELSLRT